MKQFNLQEYLATPNRQIVTRDGHNVRIICTDRKGDKPIVALVHDENEGQEYGYMFYPDGKFFIDNDKNDLFFATTKRTDYINLYRNEFGYFIGGGEYSTEDEAKKVAARAGDIYITTIKAEWEE